MVLKEFNVSQGWVQMKWNSMFKIGWSNALFALKNMEKLFEKITVYVGNYGETPTEINIQERPPAEKEIILAKGVCTWFKTPVQLIFRPGSETVEIMAISIFPSDYQSLATAYGVFADMIELYAYTANR